MRKYTEESSDHKWNAQRALSGRTHYVDPDTLKFHHIRILRTWILEDGLMFGLTESLALDMHNAKRGYRYVLFDIMGNVVSRVQLEECFKTHEQAQKAMWKALEGINGKELTRQAITQYERNCAMEIQDMRKNLLGE